MARGSAARMPIAALVAAALAAACGGDDAPSGPVPGADAGSADATPADATARDSASDAAAELDAGEPLGPPYPIVLAHGFFGFEEFAGVDFVTYFHGVKDHLAANGEPLVFTPPVDPFNDSTTRGRQLLAHVERIVAETGHARVNLVGHSQGGLDARVVAHERPDLVASVTTIATPHQGTPISDVVLQLVTRDDWREAADALVRLAGQPLWDEAGEETSLIAAMEQMSSPGMEAFNAEYTDAPGVAYYSLTGRTDWHRGGATCGIAAAPDFIARLSAELDPVDPLLEITEIMLDGGFGDPYPNDGLVRAEDARWGRFLGCIPADHLDQIGHLLGDHPGFGNDFSHLDFYAELVAWLRAQDH